MESFTLAVDLKSFFDDYRAKSVVFVNTTVVKNVKHVVHHIKEVFGIESDACIFSQDNFVPGAEDCRVLKSLPNIRLETVSPSSKRQNNNEGSILNDEGQDLVSEPTGESNQSEIFNIGHDDVKDSGHASKRKKHKRKRANSDTQDHEYSLNHQDRSDDPSSNSNTLFSPQYSEVSKISKNNTRSLYPDSYPKCDSNANQKEDTPNGAFYKKLTNKIDKTTAHVSSTRNAPTWTNIISDAVSDQAESDSNTTDVVDGKPSDIVDSKPRRKRVRKRKKAAKSEDTPQVPKISVPQVVRQCAFQSSKLSTSNSNHIFFPEEGQEELETCTEMPESEENPGEDTCMNVSLKVPDCITEKLVGQVLNNERSMSNDTNKGQENMTEPSVCKDFSKEHGNNAQSRVSENPSKCSGADVPPTVITKPKLFSVRADRGVGKLLSLVRNDSPAVFERKKIAKKEPLTPVAVLPQAEQTAKPASTFQSNEMGTLLKTIPEANTNISFKILKMSASYCPELSNSIIGLVKEVNQETQELLLKLISGAEECKKPKGKFDLSVEASEEEEPEVDEIKLNWQELIEPRICP